MSKKANPTAIGVFICVGLVLLVGGLLLFTTSRMFTPTAKLIVYFDSTLSGLTEGAPVKYRGVTIGSVYQVMIHFNQATNDEAMPVIIELQEDLIRKRLVGPTVFKSVKNLGKEIREGMRARLETESFVTGVLFVELEREESPPPAVYHQIDPVYVEIPSRPTEIQVLFKNLAKLNLADLQKKIGALADKADVVLGNLKTDQINEGLTNLLGSANRVVTTPDLTNAFTNLKDALEEYRALGANVNTNTLEQLHDTLTQIRGSMANLRDMLAADSSLRNQLSAALDQFTEAAQSISTFADFLHDHPNALIAGRKPSSEENK